MSSDDLYSFYKKRSNDFSTELTRVKKLINRISDARLVIALVFLVCLYYTFSFPALIYPTLLLLTGFVFLVLKHAKLFRHKTHLENLVAINEQEAGMLKGDVGSFSTGTEFTDVHHPYAYDLDLFGEGSLFQYINRCNTWSGKNQFAARLKEPLKSREEIQAYQEAVRDVSTKTDFRHHFQAAGMESNEKAEDRRQILEWVKQPAFLFGKPVYRFGLIVVPVTTIVLVISAFFVAAVKPWAILAALLQWAILGLHLKKVNKFHEYISRKKSILEKYAALLHYIEKEAFASSLMRELSRDAEAADVKVKRFGALTGALNARLNSMMNLFVNSLLLYDLQCVYRLEKWKHEHARHLERWLNVITETEVVCSFGSFAFNHPQFTYATIGEDPELEVRQLGHPLISDNERVTNDLIFGREQSVLIITGANMAGKSTFLRTLGVNLVLALNGAPVCASTFVCPVIEMRTGMRTADSLKDHQSYFYAELDRLKTIMDELRSGKPLLILLDEILKGTNSTDKQAGSIALVKQLLQHPCLAIIATHDLALGDLEKVYPSKVRNYCFEPFIERDQLSFDYKLKPGLAQKMNATFLMKKMGIIPSD